MGGHESKTDARFHLAATLCCLASRSSRIISSIQDIQLLCGRPGSSLDELARNIFLHLIDLTRLRDEAPRLVSLNATPNKCDGGQDLALREGAGQLASPQSWRQLTKRHRRRSLYTALCQLKLLAGCAKKTLVTLESRLFRPTIARPPLYSLREGREGRRGQNRGRAGTELARQKQVFSAFYPGLGLVPGSANSGLAGGMWQASGQTSQNRKLQETHNISCVLWQAAEN